MRRQKTVQVDLLSLSNNYEGINITIDVIMMYCTQPNTSVIRLIGEIMAADQTIKMLSSSYLTTKMQLKSPT